MICKPYCRNEPKIPRARDLLEEAKKFPMHPTATRLVDRALDLMYREAYIRRVPGKRQVIDYRMRRSIERLADTDMTMAQIATRLGIRNGGRVSEVLNGKR